MMICLTFVISFSFPFSADALRLATGNSECPTGGRFVRLDLGQDSEETSSRLYEKALSCMGETGSMSSSFRASEKRSKDLEEGVLVFVPGVARARIDNVKKTVAWLQNQNIPTECIIYQYEKSDASDDELRPCKVIYNAKQKWMDHILQVPLNMTKKKYVLHLMDGLRIEAVDLNRMVKSMVDNDLVHVSPALYGKYLLPTMLPHLGFGRRVNFIEYHMDLMTRDHFACLQDIIDSKHTENGKKTTENHLGWYVARVVPIVCRGGMGVIDAMKVFKFAHGSYKGSDARNQGKHWAAINHWEDLKPDERETLGPLKGDRLAGDPQCDGPQARHQKRISTDSCVYK